MSLFINGKKIGSAYIGGHQIIGRDTPPCYGTLTCLGDDGTEYNIIVDQLDDYNLLFRYYHSGDHDYDATSITFSFGEVLVANIIGWTFNTTDGSSYVTQTIGDSFLRNFTNLKYAINIPSWVKTIGDDFMSGCINFKSNVTLPNELETIGDNFMSGCISFNSNVTLPEGLENIGTYFMHGCYSVKSLVNFPTTVNILDSYVVKDYSDNFRINGKEYECNVKSLSNFIVSKNRYNSIIFNNCNFIFPLIENITSSFCNAHTYKEYEDIKFSFNNFTFGPNLNNIGDIFYCITLDNCNIIFSDLTYNCSVDSLFTECNINGLNLTLPTNKIMSIGNLFSIISCNLLNIVIPNNIRINNSILDNVEANEGSIYYIQCDAPITNITYNENNFTSDNHLVIGDDITYWVPNVTFHFSGPYASEWQAAYPDNKYRSIVLG